MSLITDITSLAGLRKLLEAKKDRLVVIDFHAAWCGPCHAIAPTFEKLSGVHRNVTFARCDVDACQEVAKEYAVSAMPTFVFIKSGTKIDQVRGANANALEAAIKKYASSGSSEQAPFPGQGHSLKGETAQTLPKAMPALRPGSNNKLVAYAAILIGVLLWFKFAPAVAS